MSNLKNANQKSKNLTVVNFAKYASNKNITSANESKVSNQKSLLYNYPEHFTSLMISSDEGKKFRSKLRSKLINFANQIFTSVKTKNAELFEKTKNDFLLFYKENYKLNDFSVNSITHKKDIEGIDFMLQIIKENLGEQKETKTKKEKSVTKKVAKVKKDEVKETTEETIK